MINRKMRLRTKFQEDITLLQKKFSRLYQVSGKESSVMNNMGTWIKKNT